MCGKTWQTTQEVTITDLISGEVQEWSDASWAEGVAAGATRATDFYLGEWATAMDTELNLN